MIDTHCHIDLYPNPLEIARECEQNGIATLAMTSLPSHFEVGRLHLLNFKKVRIALGLHPLRAESHVQEFPLFLKNLKLTSYIGEIGLDFSKAGIATKKIQVEYFTRVLESIHGKKKLLSIHSRRAEREVLNLLIKHKIDHAIFHWYSGPTELVKEIISAGYYFSINTAMILSVNGRKIIDLIPKEKLLTESDGPYIQVEGKIITPTDIRLVHKYLSQLWNTHATEVEAQIDKNFYNMVSYLKY